MFTSEPCEKLPDEREIGCSGSSPMDHLQNCRPFVLLPGLFGDRTLVQLDTSVMCHRMQGKPSASPTTQSLLLTLVPLLEIMTKLLVLLL